MAEPIRVGVEVTLSEDQEPLGMVRYDVVDDQGNRSVIEATGEGVNLDVVAFVDLDNGDRIRNEAGGLGLGAIPSAEELDAEMREYVYEDEIRDVAATDPEVREVLGELEDLIEALSRSGVEANETQLRGLPFVMELDEAVREHLAPET